MKSSLLLLTVIIGLFGVTHSTAASTSSTVQKPLVPLSNFLVRHWNTRDGLPHNSVNKVVQDNKGYLWLATWQGPVRFTGQRFDVFDNLRETGLPDIGMFSAAYSHCDGSVYIGGSRGGIAQHIDGQWQALEPAPPFVNNLRVDDNCNLWVASSELGLLVYKNNQRAAQFSTQHGLNSPFVYDALLDRSGNLWVATAKGLQIKRAGHSRFTDIQGVPKNDVTTLLERDNGRILAGTKNGLYQQNSDRPFSRFLPDITGSISAIFQSSNNTLWIGTYQNGFIRHSQQGTETFNTAQGLPNNHILDITEDQEGSIWVSSHGGLTQFRDALFVTRTVQDGLAGNYVRALAQADNGDVIIGSSNGLSRINGHQITPLGAQTALQDKSILSLAYDNAERLYVGTYASGLYVWSNGTVTEHFTSPNRLSSNEIRQIETTDTHGVFLATAAGITHLYQDNDDQWRTQHITQQNGLSNNYITTVFFDSHRQLWAGTSAGVDRIDVTTTPDGYDYQVTPVDLTPLDNAQLAFQIIEKAGYIWMATDRGIVAHNLNDGTEQIFNRDQGLPYDNFIAIGFDGDANLWLGSNRGAIRVEHDAFTRVLAGESTSLDYQRFTEVDGLESAQINSGGPSILQARDGSIWLATGHGASTVSPERITDIGNQPPNVTIEQVTADGEPIAFGQELNARTNRVTINFVAPGYLMAEQIDYQVRLNGFEDNWVNKGDFNSVEYTNLPASHYTFQVRARYPGGAWSGSDYFSFQQSAHFWMQPWFWILSLVCSALLALFAVRFRLNQHQRTRQQLERMVKEKTADLETMARQDPLTTLGNRRAFDERLHHELSRSQREGTYLSLAILDVDHFKEVNDVYLHTIGDKVLVRLAEVLSQELRDIDYVARWGGEEFAVLITNAELGVAREASERMRERIASTRFTDLVGDMKITVSIGVASSFDYADHASLLIAADQALYEAKSAGRNQVESKP